LTDARTFICKILFKRRRAAQKTERLNYQSGFGLQGNFSIFFVQARKKTGTIFFAPAAIRLFAMATPPVSIPVRR
jgi:hypothetical protein